MVDVIKLPVPAPQDANDGDDHARAGTQRNRRLFDWAEAVLAKLRLDKAVAAARTVDELRRITFDLDSAEVTLAIRDALHPATGHPQEHFRGLKEGGLKLILKNRFTELKKAQEAILLRGKQPDWTDKLILDRDDKILPNLANVILILTEAPKWKGVLGYDEFNARVVIRKRPPWGDEMTDSPWTDHHESLARVWFQTENINPSAGDIGRAVQAAGRNNPFHPVRDLLDSLVWNGVPRSETWLVRIFHAPDTPYIRAIARRYLISAVARILVPGCKADHMLTLEGPQGRSKSEALRALAMRDEFFTDRLSHVQSKDAALEMTGVWIVELAEMDALARATASATKSFLTRRTDRFRPPFGKHMTALPRQCVFAGTVNPPENGRYLKDPTGARRIWPVACQGMIDLAGLMAEREQLWAEAVHRFRAGEPWWLDTPELEALATAEQARRLVIDSWADPISDWLGDRMNVSVTEILLHVFGIAEGASNHSAEIRVAKILKKHLGFKKGRPQKKGERENRYYREPQPQQQSGS
jgi:predicted P-loop ATPase